MREVKFRAWANGSMWLVNGLACSDNSDRMDLVDHSIGGYERVCDYDEVDYCVLMQYVGLEDKNGKEIYEGDIVKTDLGNGVVVFDSGAFQIKNLDDGEWYWFNDFFSLYEGGCYLVEVIGNIYENPELLLEVNGQ